jgi:integrase/recombinase XerD
MPQVQILSSRPNRIMDEDSRLIHRRNNQVASEEAETRRETTCFLYLITRKGVVFLLLKFIIKDFLEDRKFNNCSPKTVTSYANTLNQFQEYCITKDYVNVDDITSATVKAYLNYCMEVRKNVPTSINHKIIDLKSFFHYCTRENIINEKRNPCEKLGKLKTDIRIEAFTDEQITQILNYYRSIKGKEKSFFAVRDYLIVLTLLGTGIRLGEAINIAWNDLDLTNSKVIVFGKKRMQRTIPVVEKLRKELVEWKLFQSQYLQGKNVEYVFSTVDGEKMSENAIKNIFRRLKEIMNFKNVRLSAHTFRHTFCKSWIMANGDQFSLQRILGHSSLDMVNRYVSLFGSAIKELNDKYNPLNAFML